MTSPYLDVSISKIQTLINPNITNLTYNIYQTLLDDSHNTIVEKRMHTFYLLFKTVLEYDKVNQDLMTTQSIIYFKSKSTEYTITPYIKYTTLSNSYLAQIINILEDAYFQLLTDATFVITIGLFSNSQLFDISIDINGDIIVNGLVFTNTQEFLLDMLLETYYQLYLNIDNTYYL